MTDKSATVNAVAEAWASIDGRLDQYEAERDGKVKIFDEIFRGSYLGYQADAGELIRRIECRGFTLVPLSEESGA